jgi:hypothetical protein
MTAKAEQAKTDLLAAQQAASVKVAEAALAAQKATASDKALREAARKQEAADAKAAVKAAKKLATDAGPGATVTAPPVVDVAAVAAKGTAKDVAEMAAKLVTGHTAPDDVLLEVLRLLAHSPELSKAGQRAATAAITSYNTPTLPTAIAERNGVVAAA